ncbi:GNAT family N-acetyltransferase [Altericroceibacterium spongiae]|uniref:GNAT family N-acetyltransferase n=2 Tax=Altericroceibacterium spongiae TaxID=2320269 RepID=A0A420EMD1_9SPHN|nr:GNAT family N-acetyltransferase [Altericroceibacterium spongiae]
MDVMEVAFDPAFGEAWTRRQVSDSLLMPNTYYWIAGPDGREPGDSDPITGFAMSRCAVDEEELLLLAVHPDFRRCGIGRALLGRFIINCRERGINRVFLEMRDGNPAEKLYRACGFTQIGRRINYYRNTSAGPIDALTFSLNCID